MTGKRYILIELFLVIILSYLLINLFLTYNRKQNVSSNTVVEEKICYLTFDDGPSKNTEKILDILAEYDAKATFFLLGCELSEEKRPVLERIIKEGHAVGLHSNIHKYDKLYADEETCLKDFDSEYQILKEEYGVDTKLLRFPGGSTCVCLKGRRESFINTMRENGFRCFDWHVSGEDSVGNPTVWSIQKNVFDWVFNYNYPIVLLHDSKIADTTVEALPGILEKVKEAGYSFETLEEREEYLFRLKK